MSGEASSVRPRTTRNPRSRSDRVVGILRERERTLWGLMVLGLVLDTALTYYGIHAGVPEGNPAVRASIDAFGMLGGVLAPKTVALSLGIVGAMVVPDHNRPLVPLALAVPWILAGGINVAVLFLL